MTNSNNKKLKILVLGDPHGTRHFLNHNFNDYDSIVILGDFFDNWHNNWINENQIEILQEALYLQQNNPKIHLVLGNHDFQYLANEEYSGKQYNKQWDIKEFLEEHLKEFNIVYQIKNYLFSHAGLSKTWCEDWKITDIKTINSMFHNRIYGAFSFYPWDSSMCGNSPYQSPIWIRPEALCRYPWRNYNQVVGHTSNKGPNGVAEFTMKNSKKLIVVDNMEHTAYFEMEI